MQGQNDSDQIEINYQLTGTGWSTCHVTIGPHNASTSASYLSDALGELARSVVDLKNGAVESMAQFDEEPGEYRWLFYRNEDRMRLVVLWFDDLWSNEPEESGKVVLDAECSFDAFTRVFVAALRRVLDEHGVEGYKAKWVEHDFPIDSYNKLQL